MNVFGAPVNWSVTVIWVFFGTFGVSSCTVTS